MAQEKLNITSDSGKVSLIPKASIDIAPGDLVVMPRTADPISISALGPTPGRIEPIAAAREGQWMAGIVDGDRFSLAVVGSVDYAAPDQDNAMTVRRRGVVRLALVPTSGKAGDYVKYSTGGTGAQLFAIDNTQRGQAVAILMKDYTGATANDVQYCELLEVPLGGPNLYHFLENRVVDGCEVQEHSAAASRSQNVKVGFSSTTAGQEEKNLVLIQNRLVSLASNFTLDIGDCSVTGASNVRFRYVVARSGAFATRTASGRFTLAASYTNSGVSALMMVPATMTAGEVPIALIVNFSQQSYTNGLIHNLRSPGLPRVGSWGL